jgi:hypothetical protein
MQKMQIANTDTEHEYYALALVAPVAGIYNL